MGREIGATDWAGRRRVGQDDPVHPVIDMSTLATVGYQGRSPDDLLELLSDAGVTMVIDVRLTPVSRKPGYSKRSLGGALAEAGIGYRHLPELGNPKDNRDAFRRGERESRERFLARLATPEAEHALAEVRALMRRGENVALLCFEQDAATCHRRLVSDELAHTHPGVRVREL